MVLDVDESALSVNPLKGIAAVPVVRTPFLRSTVVAEEHETSVVALRIASKQIEDAVVVEQEVLGVAVLGSNDVWTLNEVLAKEDRLKVSAQGVSTRRHVDCVDRPTKFRPTMS